jgi:ubiquinone/menaquinone biosynthesis C-methylase UbiE
MLFKPWAQLLVEAYGPWEGQSVLDLASGTGIVAHLLAIEVGDAGSVIGTDLNEEMLRVAEAQCESLSNVRFIACPAEDLASADRSVDYVVCQQGFQFFPDKRAAAKEMLRVLRPGGTAIVSVWRPVSECQFFGEICDALAAISENEIANMMRVPFDFMPRDELVDAFESAGFSRVDVDRVEKDLLMEGRIQQAIEAAYATPIGPSLRALPGAKQSSFVEELTKKGRHLLGDGMTMGKMASDVLVAVR